jgi:hypothetical protein
MMGKIIYSTWFALLILAVAALSLLLLYVKGRIFAAILGGGLLALATILIFLGNRSK